MDNVQEIFDKLGKEKKISILLDAKYKYNKLNLNIAP